MDYPQHIERLDFGGICIEADIETDAYYDAIENCWLFDRVWIVQDGGTKKRVDDDVDWQWLVKAIDRDLNDPMNMAAIFRAEKYWEVA